MRTLNHLYRAVTRRLAAWLALGSAARTSRRHLQRASVGNILIVCYGNIYRSPFVEHYLRTRVDGAIAVRSAGFHPRAGRPSPAEHVAMARDWGVSLDDHRSRVVGSSDLAWADLIVLMDRHNWSALDAMGADPSRLVWLGALGSAKVEIPDPYGKSPAQARAVLRQLAEAGDALAAGLSASRR